LTVILSTGNSSPALRMAARTRSRLSRTAGSGRPTVVKGRQAGRYVNLYEDSSASMPNTVADRMRASMARVSGPARIPSMRQYRYIESKEWAQRMRLALAQFPAGGCGTTRRGGMRLREERRAAPNEAPTPVAYGSVHVRFPSISVGSAGVGRGL
jgi:hypothetical protein